MSNNLELPSQDNEKDSQCRANELGSTNAVTRQNRFRVSSIENFKETDPYKLLFKHINPDLILSNSIIISKQELPSNPNTHQSVNSMLSRFSKNNLDSSDQVMLNMNNAAEEKDMKQQIRMHLDSIEAVFCSKMGIRNFDNMENQDQIMMDEIGGKCKIFGIFDGHGEHGKIIAKTACAIFTNFIKKFSIEFKFEDEDVNLENFVLKTLEKTNASLLHYKSNEAQFSGTTALLVFLTSKKINVFNVGNSRVVLAKFYPKKDAIKPFQLTHDQTINRFDERCRILESGGVIAQFKDENKEDIGPERIWIKNEKYPGIFITRCLGLSCSQKIGVIADPEVATLTYDESLKYLLMGSDGYWATMTNQESISILETYYPFRMKEGVNKLMQACIKKWKDKNQLMDDISIIAIPLK